jgi:NAD-dependent DNA ligase
MKNIANKGFVNDIAGKNFAFFGLIPEWPSYMFAKDAQTHVEARGALVHQKVAKDTDYLVIGAKREKGRADAIRRAVSFRQACHESLNGIC